MAHVKEKGNNADRWDSRPLPRLQPGCTAFLSAVGLRVEAEWLVKRIVPTNGRALEKEGFDAAIGRAPSVYDPGGLTALALRIDSPSAVQRFEEFSAASSAVLAIVPLFTSDGDLRAELDRRSYVVASEWYAGPVSSLRSA